MSVAREQLNLIDGIITETLLKQEEMRKMESLLDKELADIDHIIEFSNFNGYEGYLLAKRMKDILITRREIKNELRIMEEITKGFTEHKLSEVSKKVTEVEKVVKNQKYKFRVLTESTDGDIIKIVKRNNERVFSR